MMVTPKLSSDTNDDFEKGNDNNNYHDDDDMLGISGNTKQLDDDDDSSSELDDDIFDVENNNNNNNKNKNKNRNRTNNSNSDTYANELLAELAKDEQKAVKLLRIIIAIVLSVAAISTSLFVYFYTKLDETSNFESQFYDLATRLVDGFHDNTMLRLQVMEMLSISLTSYAISTNQSWPLVTIPDFDARASSARSIVQSAYLGLYPYITNETRQAWEEYSVKNILWINESLAYQNDFYNQHNRSARHQRQRHLTVADEVVPSRHDLLHSSLRSINYHHRDLQTELDLELDLNNFNNNNDNGEKKLIDVSPNATFDLGYSPDIYRFGDPNIGEGALVIENGPGPYYPMWQISPTTEMAFAYVNYNVRDPYYPGAYVGALDELYETNSAVFAGVWNVDDNGYINNDDDYDLREVPVAGLLYPVFNSTMIDDNKHVVAVLDLDLEFGAYFRSVLPSDSDSIVCVIESSCGQVFTYEVTGGTCKYLGPQDLHDTTFDKISSLKVSAKLSDATSRGEADENDQNQHHYNGVTVNHDYCPWTLNIYPTKVFHDQYITQKPVHYTGAVFGVFLLTCIVFTGYDCCVEKRQRIVLNKAVQLSTIVYSLFPQQFRDRLFQENYPFNINTSNKTEQKSSKKKNKKRHDLSMLAPLPNSALGGGVFGGGGGVPIDWLNSQFNDSSTTTKSKNKHSIELYPHSQLGGGVFGGGGSVRFDFFNPQFNGGCGPPRNNNKIPSSNNKINTKSNHPIAELYPHCTVLFADIAGFTAWSSARDPSQVFTLLEAMYSAMDKIAACRKVFKVETIGDSYVAVTGLPDPQPKHALIMARFAKDCLVKVSSLTSALEVTLGPGTGDLSVRVGLHSGPVTAGILRGEKSRFQLFGDTVNTAARMESTGKVNRIHASETTASLLMKAGKSYWVEKREDKVVAKGKGEMQTYWLSPGAPSKGRSGSNCSAVSSMSSSVNSSMRSVVNYCGAVNTDNNTPPAAVTSAGDELSSNTKQHKHRYDFARIKRQRMIDWIVDLFMDNLRKICVHRIRNSSNNNNEVKRGDSINGGLSDDTVWKLDHDPTTSPPGCNILKTIRDECTDTIFIPKQGSENYNDNNTSSSNVMHQMWKQTTSNSSSSEHDANVTICSKVASQLRDFVEHIASMYQDNPFHNFEHACQVLMSTDKMLKQVKTASGSSSSNTNADYYLNNNGGSHIYEEVGEGETTNSCGGGGEDEVCSYGFASDPLARFTILLVALIHDVGHPGITNTQLIHEQTKLATRYRNQSVLEQNSVEVTWNLLMEDKYIDLRNCLCTTKKEFHRFRQLVVNLVIATDIMDKELTAQRKNRWSKAFGDNDNSNKKSETSSSVDYTKKDTKTNTNNTSMDNNKNSSSAGESTTTTAITAHYKSTIVMEFVIQASDVAHTMQHWKNYIQWNQRLFKEMYLAFLANRHSNDPSLFWYEGEISFFDNYIIPLAEKLDKCYVFGASSSQYLDYAKQNRTEWELKGKQIVQSMLNEMKEMMATKTTSTTTTPTTTPTTKLTTKRPTKMDDTATTMDNTATTITSAATNSNTTTEIMTDDYISSEIDADDAILLLSLPSTAAIF